MELSRTGIERERERVSERERERVLVLVLVYFRAHEEGAKTPTRYNELHLNRFLLKIRPKAIVNYSAYISVKIFSNR